MKKPNLNKIIADNLDKAKFQSKSNPSLPTNGWLDAYSNGGIYLSDRAKATQFGQYANGGQPKPKYKQWLKTVNPDFISNDYNLEDAYNELPYKRMQAWARDPLNNHLPDTYKLPNHESFSNQSKYYDSFTPGVGGYWGEGEDNFIRNPKIGPPIPSAKWMGQYKKGGGYFPEYHSWAPPRMDEGGDCPCPEYDCKCPEGYERLGNATLVKQLDSINGLSAMQPFYDDLYQAGNKYSKDGHVSGFNAARAVAKAFIKHPNVLFMKRHLLPGNVAETNPYGVESYTSGKQNKTWHPTEWAEPLKERPHPIQEWMEKMRMQHEDNRMRRRGTRDAGRTDCWGANCYENDLSVGKYGGDISIPILTDPKWLTKYQTKGQVDNFKFGDFRGLQNQMMNSNSNSFIQERQRLNAIAQENQRRNEATAKRTFISQGRSSTPESEARRLRLNQQYAAQQPNAQIDEQGNISRVNPNRSVTGAAENFMSRREDKAAEHALGALEAAGYVTGAAELGQLGYGALRNTLGESMESGLLSKAYKLNPWAFKPQEGMMYRGLGEEGFKDAIESGVFRPKQHGYPQKRNLSEIVITPKQFDKTYYAPAKKFDIIERYGPEYVAEVPFNESNFSKRYGNKDWSWNTSRQIPIEEGRILQKDWLRGYKPVEVPKIEIPPSSKPVDKFISSEPQILGVQHGMDALPPGYNAHLRVKQGYVPPSDDLQFMDYSDPEYSAQQKILNNFLKNKPTTNLLPEKDYSNINLNFQDRNNRVKNAWFNKKNSIEQLPPPAQSGFNPLAIADQLTPRINPLSFLEDGPDMMSFSPLNKLPFYGKKLTSEGEIFGYPGEARRFFNNELVPKEGISRNASKHSVVGFRKFGNSIQDVIDRKALSPKGGSTFRIGRDQIVGEGNWAAADKPWEKYQGVFEATMNPYAEGSNIKLESWKNRSGVVGTTAEGNPEIPLTDPGLSFNRRLPFSTRYVPIDKQRLMNNQFQLATFAPHLQSLAEKYGIGLGGAATLGYIGYPDAVKTYNKYTIDPLIEYYNKADSALNKYVGTPLGQIPKQNKGGIITDPMGQWAHPGENTRIPGSNITMQGVSYPVLAKASNGMSTMMYPGQNYSFPGASHVDEYPMARNGGQNNWLNKYK